MSVRARARVRLNCELASESPAGRIACGGDICLSGKSQHARGRLRQPRPAVLDLVNIVLDLGSPRLVSIRYTCFQLYHAVYTVLDLVPGSTVLDLVLVLYPGVCSRSTRSS